MYLSDVGLQVGDQIKDLLSSARPGYEAFSEITSDEVSQTDSVFGVEYWVPCRITVTTPNSGTNTYESRFLIGSVMPDYKTTWREHGDQRKL